MASFDLQQVAGWAFALGLTTWVLFAFGMIGLYRVGAAARFWLDRQKFKEQQDRKRQRSEGATHRVLDTERFRQASKTSATAPKDAQAVPWWEYEGLRRK